MPIDTEILMKFAAEIGVSLDDAALKKLSDFKDLVVDANTRFNLTNILDEPDFTMKHLADSISAIPYIPTDSKVLDIGTGAGFPAMPLALIRGDIALTALDATSKKVDFLNSAADTLGVNNLKAVSGRAEELKSRGTFDVALARAVAPLPILLELAVPLLKVKGIFIAYKTDLSELESAKGALNTLFCTLKCFKQFKLPNGDSRALLIFEKEKDTPAKYPRVFGQIKKKPL